MKILGGFLLALPFLGWITWSVWDSSAPWEDLRDIGIAFGIAIAATVCILVGGFLLFGANDG